MPVIDPGQLAATVNSLMAEYVELTNDALDDAAEQVSKEAVARLKSSSPGNGTYANSWTVKKESKARKTGRLAFIIHNREHYRLTHVLEKGHAKVLWGRRTGERVSEHVHIAPVEEQAVRDFERLLRSNLESIT